jgi:hypothetical protein
VTALAEHEQKHSASGASAASPVAAAAASAKLAQAGLFTGSAASGGGAAGGDAAAAAAFKSHTAAAAVDATSSISAMFAAADPSDPYSALHASAAPARGGGAGAGAGGYKGGYAAVLSELLTATGSTVSAAAARRHDELAALEAVWLRALKGEHDKQAELGSAIKRRELAVERVQEANAALQRKKKALALVKPTAPDAPQKNAEASAAVERADRDLAASREQLDKMTGFLKLEMARTSKARRHVLVAHLAAYAKLQAAQAKEVRAAGSARRRQRAARESAAHHPPPPPPRARAPRLSTPSAHPCAGERVLAVAGALHLRLGGRH